MTEPKTWQLYAKYLNAELFTLIYFMSEVYRFKNDAVAYFGHLLAKARSGALMLYIDNNNESFSSWFDGLASAHGWEKVEQGCDTIGMPAGEEKTSLGRYFQKFQFPKLDSNIAFRVIRKR